MKKWLIILCIAMGLLLIIGLWFIGAGLQREDAAQQLQQDMQEQPGVQAELAVSALFGEATHV